MVGYSPWDHKELDMTEQLHFLSFFFLLLTLQCAYVSDRLKVRKVQSKCCVLFLWFHGDLTQLIAETLSRDYTDLLMLKAPNVSSRGATRDRQSFWTKLSFLGQSFHSL